VIKDFQKALQPSIEEFYPETKKDTAVNAIIHTARPYACWTTTAATTVPPSEQ